MTCEELTGNGDALMAWYYHKCVVMTCDYGTLDYSDDAGLSSVNLGIRYSNFTTWMPDFQYATMNDDGAETSHAASSGFGTTN